ncbi:MAG: hypothetical protein JNJ60_13705, partial [Rhodocyclaceae bacterium]|nr:hypothetical protein [Rhodocyclaceae bacterium]
MNLSRAARAAGWRFAPLPLVLLLSAAVAAPQARIPPSALRVTENSKDGTTWTKLASGVTDIAWTNPGGDWVDADGVKQGPLPWASASFAKINAE